MSSTVLNSRDQTFLSPQNIFVASTAVLAQWLIRAQASAAGMRAVQTARPDACDGRHTVIRSAVCHSFAVSTRWRNISTSRRVCAKRLRGAGCRPHSATRWTDGCVVRNRPIHRARASSPVRNPFLTVMYQRGLSSAGHRTGPFARSFLFPSDSSPLTLCS